MGAVSVDIHAKDRVLDTAYPLHTEKGINKLLHALPYIKEGRFLSGDFGASDLIMDLEKAMDKAKLSPIQHLIIDIHYRQGYTQAETIKKLESYGYFVTQQAISDSTKFITRNISKYFRRGQREWEI